MAHRIALIDDHALVRDGIARLLESTEGLEVVGEAGSVAAGEALIADTRPHVTLLDVDLPDGSGLDLCGRISGMTRVLMLSASGQSGQFSLAMENGARGYVLKRADSAALVRSVLQVIAGEVVVDPVLQTELFSAVRNDTTLPPPVDRCDRKQLELLLHLAKGATTAEIASAMYVSGGTCRNWISRLLRTIDARNRTEAALIASQHQGEIEMHLAATAVTGR
ncbi:MAG: response regulator transcription factor [Acidimicrobiales bacterium]